MTEINGNICTCEQRVPGACMFVDLGVLSVEKWKGLHNNYHAVLFSHLLIGVIYSNVCLCSHFYSSEHV